MIESIQIDQVWMGSRTASEVHELAPWVAAVVGYFREGASTLIYPLNLDQAEQLRDRLLTLAKGKPKTASERYAANKARIGLSFKFDKDADGIFVADRGASPPGIIPEAVGSISFKSELLDRIHCIQLTADDCKMFGEVMITVLAKHIEPPEDIEA